MHLIAPNIRKFAQHFSFTDTHDRIEVWICSGELQLFPITPQNLVLDSDELIYFMEDPSAVVNFAPNSHHRFYYLPKYCIISSLVILNFNLL